MVYDKWFMREYPTKKMDLLGGLVAINFIFPYIGLLSSSQLTKSIIFQDGVALAHQPAERFPRHDGEIPGSNVALAPVVEDKNRGASLFLSIF